MSNKKFIESIPVGPLAIVALPGSKALGDKVDAYISGWRSERLEAKESPITFKNVIGVRLIFQPCTTVRNYCTGIQLFS